MSAQQINGYNHHNLFTGIISASTAAVITTSAILWGNHTVAFIQNLQNKSLVTIAAIPAGVALLSAVADTATRGILEKTLKVKSHTALLFWGTTSGLSFSVGLAATLMHYSIIPLQLSEGAPLIAFGGIIFLLFKIASTHRTATSQTPCDHEKKIAELTQQIEDQKEILLSKMK